MKAIFNLNGNEVELFYQLFDFSTLLPDDLKDNPAAKFLVRYSDATGVTVDSRAPQEYRELAALQLEICHGNNPILDSWAGIETGQDDFMRCRLAEEKILSSGITEQRGVNRNQYAKQRRQMFAFRTAYYEEFAIGVSFSFVISTRMAKVLDDWIEKIDPPKPMIRRWLCRFVKREDVAEYAASEAWAKSMAEFTKFLTSDESRFDFTTPVRLEGIVFHRKDVADGETIKTSKVVAVEVVPAQLYDPIDARKKFVATTASGSRYEFYTDGPDGMSAEQNLMSQAFCRTF